MQTWFDLGKVAIVAAVFGVCFTMLVGVVGGRSPWLGLLLMFYFMGLARVAEPLVRLRLPRALRTVGARPLVHAVCRRLGVHAFGALLRNTPLRRLNGSVYLADGRRTAAELLAQAESAEAIHFWAAVLFMPYIAYVASRGFVVDAVVFVLVQIVVNGYPILHLRLLRARLCRIEQKRVKSNSPVRPRSTARV